MPVNRLYQQDSYLRETVTDIVTCEQVEQGWALTLKDTIFHAKGGGQPSDRGRVGGQPLIDLVERGEEILHLVADKPAQTEGVLLELDWEHRFDLMQQHTGQHVLSTVIDNLFQSDTSIFRSEERICQIDLSKPLTAEQLAQAERETNRLLREGRSVRSFQITQQQIPEYQLKMRLPLAPHEVVQLVEIEDFDLIGCGGTHVSTTDQVGSLKILSAKDVSDQKTAKGVMRLYFLCGGRAEADYDFKNRAFYELSALLGGEPEQLPEQVRELKRQADALSARGRRLQQRLLELESADMLAKARQIGSFRLVTALLEGQEVRDLKAVAESLTMQQDAVVLLASDSGESLPVLMAQTKGLTSHNVGAWIKELMEAQGGRGGGGAVLAQGTLPNSEQALQAVRSCFERIAGQLEGGQS